MNTHQAAVEAIKRATRFLGSASDEGGMWADFDTAIGSSDDWVTAYVVASIAGCGPARPLAERALLRLYGDRRRPLGWGYSWRVGPDSDSTSWALVAAAAVGRRYSLIVPSLIRFLLLHQDGSGGFSTYAATAVAPARVGGTRDSWFAPQPCVTALNLLALLSAGVDRTAPPLVRAGAFLAEGVRSGLRSSWWGDSPYVAYHSARALFLLGRGDELWPALLASVVDRGDGAGGWGSSVSARAACFHTACALQTLLLEPSRRVRPLVDRTVRWLLERQDESGAFPGGPLLFVPDDRPGEDRTSQDTKGVFSTATCVKALTQYVQQVVG